MPSPLQSALAQIDELTPGWCTAPKASRLAQIVKDAGAGGGGVLAVELGVYGGRSAIAMALAIRFELGGRGRVDAIDPYSLDAWFEGYAPEERHLWCVSVDLEAVHASAVRAVDALGVGRVVTFRVMRSEDAAALYAPGSVDVLHQDGNHSELVSSREVLAWADKVRPGGMWVADDTDWATTKRAQGELCARGFARVEDHGSWAVFRAPSA